MRIETAKSMAVLQYAHFTLSMLCGRVGHCNLLRGASSGGKVLCIAEIVIE